jgi:FecR protein
MATTRVSHFELDWWIVQKRGVYLTAFAILVCVVFAAGALYVWKYGNPLRNVAMKVDAPPGARFLSFEGDVRVIRAATRQVVSANNDLQLYPGDTVQTQTDGRARISMADGSTVVVRPNSTIIIRDNESAEDGKRSNVRVVVDSGQMFVSTAEQSDENKNVVETPKTKNQITGQSAASFGVNPGGSEEIRVNRGLVQSASSNGDGVALRGGEYVAVNQSGTISKPQRLLDVPQPSQPQDMEKIAVSSAGSATVQLRWQKPQAGIPANYRVEVATSPFFVREGIVVERDQLMLPQFNVSDLRPGSYFWRVRATATSGQTSDWSEPLKFIVIARGGSSATVQVSNLNAVHLGGNVFLINGSVSAGATIRVLGREASATGEGTFQVQITVPPETREVTLQASDQQGNVSSYRVPLNRSS